MKEEVISILLWNILQTDLLISITKSHMSYSLRGEGKEETIKSMLEYASDASNTKEIV